MKLKINRQMTEEIDITFPYYCSDGYKWLRFDSEKNGVFIFDAHPVSTKIEYGVLPEQWLLCPKISKEEFDNKFNELITRIKNVQDGSK